VVSPGAAPEKVSMYTHTSFMPDGAALLTVVAWLAPAVHTVIAMQAMATETAFAVLRGKDLNIVKRSSDRVRGCGMASIRDTLPDVKGVVCRACGFSQGNPCLNPVG
jgi:hypothetical protein